MTAADGGGDSGAGADAPVGLLIECDGALVDAHVEGHRVAFNRAFSVSAGRHERVHPSVAPAVAETPRTVVRCLPCHPAA